MQTTVDAIGTATAGAVWERFVNPERWSSWAPQITGVDYAQTRLTSGTTGRVHGPLRIRLDFEIENVDEVGRTWTWRTWWLRRTVCMTLTHGVAPCPDGSRAWVTVDGSPLLVLPNRPMSKLALTQLVQP